MLHVRPEAADAGDDVLAVVGMLADGAGQREQLHRAVEVDVVGRDALGQARALGLHRLALLVLGGFAELQIAAEAAGAHRDFEAGVGILAELAHAAAVAIGADR